MRASVGANKTAITYPGDDDKKWQAESDLRVLKEHADLVSDPVRHAAAKKLAKEHAGLLLKVATGRPDDGVKAKPVRKIEMKPETMKKPEAKREEKREKPETKREARKEEKKPEPRKAPEKAKGKR